MTSRTYRVSIPVTLDLEVESTLDEETTLAAVMDAFAPGRADPLLGTIVRSVPNRARTLSANFVMARTCGAVHNSPATLITEGA